MVGPIDAKPIEDRVADVEARLEEATAAQVERIDAIDAASLETMSRIDEIAETVAKREALLERLADLERRLSVIEPDLKWLHEERQKAKR